ncbi:MAG TPA: PAS domain S-box protein, partial [Rhodopila sp.]|nr:PAS domain S-box protein [Rhodopila sp.]
MTQRLSSAALRSPPGSTDAATDRYRRVIDAAITTGIVVTDCHETILDWNRGAVRLLGWTEAEVVGKKLDTLLGIRAEAGASPQAADAARRMGIWLPRRDGTRMWAQVEATPLLDVAGRTSGTVRIILDRTDDREAAESLRSDRDRLWQFSTDLMVVAGFDGAVQALNPAWTQTLGWTEAEMLGRRLFDLVHPDDLDFTLKGVEELQTNQSRLGMVNRYRHKDGSYRWISWNSVPGGGVINAIGRDFTAEKQQAEALTRSELRMRSIFESSYQYQGLLDPDGTILHANPTSLAAIEARLDDVVGRKMWESPWFALTPGMPEQVKAAIQRVAAGESMRQEVTLNLPAGETILDFSLRPVFDADGAVTAILPEAMDLSQRREAEARLRQAYKMEAVGQLTSGLAHDFNNLLTGVMGGLELLQLRISRGRTEGLDQYIGMALAAAERAAALTHRLLAFSRRQTLDPKPTDANELIASIGELIGRAAGPSITLETRPAAGLWTTFCDRNQLENALLNLCINARDAMPDGGRLCIATVNAAVPEAEASECGMQAGDYVTISVADTGSGMTPDVLANAFDPFFTTKPLGQGTGLGLSMIYGFTRQSGGHVKIESEVGRGTCVTMYLPRHAGVNQQKHPVRDPSAAPRAADGQTVLVVDDEPTVRRLIMEALSDLGYVATEAADGTSGLAALLSLARIDLLVTDVGLPGGMNGRQLADAAQQIRP